MNKGTYKEQPADIVLVGFDETNKQSYNVVDRSSNKKFKFDLRKRLLSRIQILACKYIGD